MRPSLSHQLATAHRADQRPGMMSSLHTTAAAYADAVSEYAALGRDELREAARAVMAVTSGRG
jgi:hypothetical protein